MKRENRVKHAIAQGKTSFGMYVDIPSPVVVEIMGLAGLDFVRIDCLHSPADLQAVDNMIRAAEVTGITPFVRVSNDAQRILSVLEMGAMGIIIPDVSTRAEAQAAVDAVKFPPIGHRAMFSCPRSSNYGLVGGAEYTSWTNNEIMLAVQIESGEAVEHIQEILGVKGIDLILSGRGDLAQSFGVPGQKEHPVVLEAERKIFASALAAGIPVSVNLDPTSSTFLEQVADWEGKGVRSISLTTDTTFLMKSLKAVVARLRQGGVKA